MLAHGTFSYDGIDLNAQMMRTQSVRSRPQMDTSGRAKSYTVHEITVRLVLTGRPTDRTVLDWRQRLTTPGKAFRYKDKGFGPLELDIRGDQDVMFGPIPRELSFDPMGESPAGGTACILMWAVSVAVVESGFANLRAGGGAGFDGLELNFSASYDIDDAGYTTRHLTVMLKTAGRRFGDGRQLEDSADVYREILAPPQVEGFRRLWGPWGVNQAKTELTGEVIDEEMGLLYPPPGFCRVEASHDVRSNVMGLSQWVGSIQASYEVIKGAPPSADPLAHFFGVVVKDRVAEIARQIGEKSKSIVPIGMELSEPEIYGRRKARLGFTFTFNQDLNKILGSTGLWRPVPGSNWKDWAASMEAGPANPRGYANMVLRPGDDLIYDPTGTGRTPPIFRSGGSAVPRTPAISPVVGQVTSSPRWTEPLLRTIPGIGPTPADSWVMYESWVWVEVDAGTIPVRPLPVAKPKFDLQELARLNPFDPRDQPRLQQIWDALGPRLPIVAPPRGGPRDPRAGGRIENPNADQQRVRPTMYVYLRGRALRHGFPVPVPSLRDFGGSVPILACRLDRGEGYGQGIVWNTGVNVLYGAQWNIRYHVPDPPNGFIAPLPPNPLLNPA